ncbi:T9SS type A sorting domain-containing protein [Halosquirtibacter laminarini]|uniref:T9SS type A sorting domain-containing protein n=1 Tax=Halosquirtibacter laminarini TaxID=3374600 RepID=A0AC61NNB1_9BACT|nr:T9SS type A sorting domain-containing protein [Prolixibacteraceae bacterium]
MRRKLFILAILTFTTNLSFAQKAYVSIKGAVISVSKEANVTIQGDFESKGEKSADQSFVTMDGSLNIFGDILNNTFPLFDEFSKGHFSFLGNQDQYITGEGTVNFSNIEVNKVPVDALEKPKIFFDAPISITKKTKLSSGIIEVGDDDLLLKEETTITRSIDGVGCFFNTDREGSVRKYFSYTEDPSLTLEMPIGANNQYSPVTVQFVDLETLNDNAQLRFKAQGKRHESMPKDGQFLNRFWEVENIDIHENTQYKMTFFYQQEDIVSEDQENTYEGIEMKEEKGFLLPFNTLEKVDEVNNYFNINAKGKMKAFTAGDLRSATFSDVIVFPTPNDGHFSIKIDNPNDKWMDYEFYNIFGQKILSGKTERGVFNFNFSKFPKGVYFYKIYFSTKTVSRKITIQ